MSIHHELNGLYNECCKCGVIVDDGAVIEENYYCIECETIIKRERASNERTH